MNTLLKIAGIGLILFSLLPGAFAAWQGYAAYSWSTGELAQGRHGQFGQALAERGAEIRRNRALMAGGASFAIFATGVVVSIVGFRRKKLAMNQPARA